MAPFYPLMINMGYATSILETKKYFSSDEYGLLLLHGAIVLLLWLSTLAMETQRNPKERGKKRLTYGSLEEPMLVRTNHGSCNQV